MVREPRCFESVLPGGWGWDVAINDPGLVRPNRRECWLRRRWSQGRWVGGFSGPLSLTLIGSHQMQTPQAPLNDGCPSVSLPHLPFPTLTDGNLKPRQPPRAQGRTPSSLSSHQASSKISPRSPRPPVTVAIDHCTSTRTSYQLARLSSIGWHVSIYL